MDGPDLKDKDGTDSKDKDEMYLRIRMVRIKRTRIGGI